MKRMVRIGVIGLLVILQGCGFYGRKRGPSDWYRIPHPKYELPPYSKWVSGLKICLDPGHGGDAQIPKYKRGPTSVREAEINLRVALYLKDFLEKSGAKVILTRDADTDIGLSDRAMIANNNKVDIFISIHHNTVDNQKTNYSSTWYHSDADYSPVSLDLARYIQLNLIEYLRLPDCLPTGLLSDYLMYPSGFDVLRYLEVPGALIESSFFSNPEEEKLVANPKYNKIEAYALFIAICQWAAAGIPDVYMISPTPDSTTTDKQPTIILKISDGHHGRKSWMLKREQVFSRSISFFLDDSLTPYTYFNDQNLIIHRPEYPLDNGWHSVRAEVTNFYGNHNFPKKLNFRVSPPADTVLAVAGFPVIPADGRSFIGIEVTALDSDSQFVADGEMVNATSTSGMIDLSSKPVKDGKAHFYLKASDTPDTAQIVIRLGRAQTHLQVVFSDSGTSIRHGESIFEGRCLSSSDSLPLEGVSITLLPEMFRQTSNADGYFFFTNIPAGEYTIIYSKNGYWGGTCNLSVEDAKGTAQSYYLREIANGIFHDFVLVIDPRYSGKEKGTVTTGGLYASQLNLELAKIVQDLFTKAGANVFLVRDNDEALIREERVDRSNQFPEGGFYLRLNLGKWSEKMPEYVGGYYAGNETSRRILTNVDSILTAAVGQTSRQIGATNYYEIFNTNRTAISMDFNWIGNPLLEKNLTANAGLFHLAYSIFRSFTIELSKRESAEK